MKRLHIIGKSKDNRRIFLARAKDAKFGSFEVPISAKLLKLVREAEDAKSPATKRGRRPAAAAAPAAEPAAPAPEGKRREAPDSGSSERPAEAKPAARRATKAEPEARRPTKAEPEADGADAARRKRPPTPAGPPAPAPDETDEVGSVRVVQRRPAAGAGSRSSAAGEGVDIPLAPRRGARRREAPAEQPPADAPEPTPARRRTAADEGAPKRAARRSQKTERPPITPRTKRPEIPARSKLSPAEIQSLIRAGRTVRTVAQMAGTQAAWVKWLAEPVQQERQAVVGQALRERQTRARLGASAEPLGTSVALNLRSRGVSGAERVVEEGFTAVRSNGRQWRVRLSFEHRGRRTSAVWSYDPQRHEVTPVNTLAAQLGWRRPRAVASGDAGSADTDGGASPRPSRRATASRGSKAAAARRSGRRSSSSRTSSRVSSRRRSS